MAFLKLEMRRRRWEAKKGVLEKGLEEEIYESFYGYIQLKGLEGEKFRRCYSSVGVLRVRRGTGFVDIWTLPLERKKILTYYV